MRKRIIPIEERIARKKAELARLESAEKQVSLSKAYRDINMKVDCALQSVGLHSTQNPHLAKS